MRRLYAWFFIALAFFTTAPLVTAQSYMDEPGIPEFTTSFPVEYGFINIANGNLHLEIPIASYPQRGPKLKYHARLVYDSRVWTFDPNYMDHNLQFAWNPNGVPSGIAIGWRLITGEESGSADHTETYTQCGCGSVPCALRTTYKNFVYQEPDGTNHRAPKSFTLTSAPLYCGGPVTPSGSAYASDNSGYKFVINGPTSVYAPDGTLVAGPGTSNVQDTNGNFSSYSAGNLVDTLGRVPVITSGSGNQTFLDYLNAQGGRSRVTLTTTPLPLATNFGTGGEYTGTLPALQTISFPDGSFYQFGYDSYGQLQTMTLPTGGQVTYGYSNLGSPTVNRWLTSRTDSANNTWTFTPTFTTCTSPCSPLKVTVSTPPYSDGTTTASDNHVYSFFSTSANGASGVWPTQIQHFRGAATGTPLLTLTKEYTNPNSSCQLPMGNPPLLVRETLAWPSASGGTLSKKAEYCYDSNGVNQITRKIWDYQPNGSFAAAPDREIDTTYVTDPAYVNANILTLPLTVTTLGPGGVQVAKTTYAYDAGTPQPSNITTQHTTPTSPRGNLTSISKWLNTTNGSVTSNTAWFDTGEVYQSTDPLGHQTTFSYDPTFAGAYITKTCNAVTQCSYSGYDLNTGLLTSSTDINGSSLGDPQHTTTYGYDSMLRPLCTTAPDGGQTCVSYPSATTTIKSTLITPAPLNDVSSMILDGLGRTSQTQHVTPAGTAKVDTTYDPLGRVSSISNPYFNTADATYGITQTTYDGLSRMIKVTRQDGSIATAQFSVISGSLNGTCVTNTDEAGKQRRLCHNGFGELVEVDEPGDSFAGSNATGALAINGTLQSKSGVGATNPTSGTGSVTITGAEASTTIDPCADQTPPIGGPPPSCPQTVWDSGTVTVTVNGHADSASYSSISTVASVASDLASAINGDAAASVNASASNAVLTLTARTTGAATNYSWSLTSSSNDPTDFGTAGSFSSSPLSGALSGGTNGSGGTTVYDAGTVTVTIGSFQASVSYSQTTNSSASAVASALATALNAGISPVTTSASGASINITYKTVGAAGNVSVNCNSSTSQPAYFTGPSFTCAGITLNGGLNPEGPSLDFNYLVTQYSYDALGNLLNVTQKGDPSVTPSSQWRVRNFTYDSLSRLLTAVNPESGTINYSYDADSNLVQKTSPRANQTGSATTTFTYCYDFLHRFLAKGFVNSPTAPQQCTATAPWLPSPTVVNTYDQGTNGIGHLTSLKDQAGTGSYTFDNMGHTTSETRSLTGANGVLVANTMSYAYNLDGSLKTLTNPSNATITYAPWNNGTAAVGWPQDVKDLGNNINYVSGATYGADGSLAGFVNGSGGTASITNSFSYNKRLQPVTMSAATPGQTVFSLTYDFHAGNGTAGSGTDNGNVWGILNNRDHTRDQSFAYDPINRLISAQNSGTDCTINVLNGRQKFWGNNYGYDAWGNLLSKSVTKCGAENLSVTADVHNWIHAAAPDYQYDAAGNMTFNATSGQSYSWDQENRLTGAAGYTYIYDDEGNRAIKSNGNTASSGTLYWYMMPGVVAESDLAGTLKSEYVFFAGGRVARKDFSGGITSVAYYFSDHLKTASVITDASGTVKADSDYYPWGGELQFLNNDSNDYKFTGKKRDTETGLDYFGARYYSGALGRWVSADWSPTPVPVPYADLKDPQTLNLYGYVRNMPMSRADEDGHGLWNRFKCFLGSAEACEAQKAEEARKQQEEKEAEHRRAEDARKTLSQMKGFTINGMAPRDFANSATDQQALAGLNAATNFVFAQAAKDFWCGPGISCGIVFPLGIGGAVVEEGAFSEYVNITRGASLTNIRTSITANEFGANLEANGFTKTTAGGVTRYTKGNTEYTVYSQSASTGGASVQVKINGDVVSKIRLK